MRGNPATFLSCTDISLPFFPSLPLLKKVQSLPPPKGNPKEKKGILPMELSKGIVFSLSPTAFCPLFSLLMVKFYISLEILKS